jgi:acetoacetate decarboxylase
VEKLCAFACRRALARGDPDTGRVPQGRIPLRIVVAELTVHECWGGPCTVELRPNAQAPVFRLPVREMPDGFFWRASFTLVPGEILFDHLADGS